MLFVFLFSLCLAGILKGAIQYYYYRDKKKSYYKTKGTIINNYFDTASGFNSGFTYTRYFPIVEYTDKEGQTVQIQSDNFNQDMPMYQVGTQVSLLVNPDDNTRLLFDDKVEEITFPLIWIGLGLLGMIVLLICLLYHESVPILFSF